MPWIKVISVDEATGFLKKQYDTSIKRVGRVWGIVSVMSQNPDVLKESMALHAATMFGSSPLSRGQREMLAVVVSVQNHCIY